MKMETKYRAWLIKSKVMIYHFDILHNFKEIMEYAGSRCRTANYWGEGEFILMQFINIIDRNKVDIYVRDIVKAKTVTGEEYIGVIEYENYEEKWKGSYVLSIDDGDTLMAFSKLDSYEVVGNNLGGALKR